MRFRLLAISLAVLLLNPMRGHAAEWRRIALAKGEAVEFDPHRISTDKDGRVLAWSRLALKQPVADAETGATYDTVEALNRYDCAGVRYATTKRLFMLGEKLVRAEPVYATKEVAIGKGSLDGTLFNEVCSAKNLATAPRADESKPATAKNSTSFGVMHAEMVTDGSTRQNRALAVADKVGEAKSTEKSAESAPRQEAPKRLLELPKIDKSQIEHPTDDPKTEAKADTAVGAKPDARASLKTAKGYEPPPLPIADRRSREMALATSGPPRAPKRKPVAPVAVETPRQGPGANHWAYEGDHGPANWARLDPKNALCATGKRQSPIDISEGIRVDLEPIRFDYKPTSFRIEDTGHTIQVTVGEGSFLGVMGRRYELRQLQFHRPAEERVDGKRYDMVVHLAHRDDEGNLAVLAIMLEKGSSEQPLIQTLWNNMPLEIGMSLAPPTPINLTNLLPEKQAYYTYMGSLTTPPCTENVLWLVMKQPVQISAEQLAIFSRLYKNNARPVQATNGRLIKESR